MNPLLIVVPIAMGVFAWASKKTVRQGEHATVKGVDFTFNAGAWFPIGDGYLTAQKTFAMGETMAIGPANDPSQAKTYKWDGAAFRSV